MAKLSANKTRLYIDEIDISGMINGYTLDLKQETARVDCLSDAGPRRVVGNYDVSDQVTSFLDPVTLVGSDAQFFNNFRTDEDHYLSTIFGTAEGSIGYDDLLRMTDQPRKAQLGGAVLLDLSGEGSGGRARATLLRAGTVTAGNGTGINQGVTASPQVYRVIFRLLAFTGTSITITVEQSSDNAAGDPYAAIAGLTSGALTTPGVAVATTTATLEAWRRVVCAGTFSNASVIVTAGVVAGSG